MNELLVIVSSTWKFALTFPIAIYLFEMSFFETIIYTNIGGLAGIVLFTLASKGIIYILNFIWPGKNRFLKRKRTVFTKQNRRLVVFKNNYGLPGVIILTSVILSIPVGVFLITKYFGRKKMNYLYLFFVQIIWSFIYTIFYTRIYQVI